MITKACGHKCAQVKMKATSNHSKTLIDLGPKYVYIYIYRPSLPFVICYQYTGTKSQCFYVFSKTYRCSNLFLHQFDLGKSIYSTQKAN